MCSMTKGFGCDCLLSFFQYILLMNNSQIIAITFQNSCFAYIIIVVMVIVIVIIIIILIIIIIIIIKITINFLLSLLLILSML